MYNRLETSQTRGTSHSSERTFALLLLQPRSSILFLATNKSLSYPTIGRQLELPDPYPVLPHIRGWAKMRHKACIGHALGLSIPCSIQHSLLLAFFTDVVWRASNSQIKYAHRHLIHGFKRVAFIQQYAMGVICRFTKYGADLVKYSPISCASQSWASWMILIVVICCVCINLHALNDRRLQVGFATGLTTIVHQA